jgi:hypothetical protein
MTQEEIKNPDARKEHAPYSRHGFRTVPNIGSAVKAAGYE